MDAEQIIAGVVIGIMFVGESGVAHVPEVVYPGPPQDVAVAQVSTQTHVVNYASGVFLTGGLATRT